ncbi:MauE/DoxX family redox-associated membrane protein [Actinoallomurus rhizosphaericola]|uniref:MauE/DoxX family redox-associated membrane protein n=1 Tax=Actinoallomurus rhizosphaericola TaxID=2952536 RepID=UPI0020911CFD|nr:MauE/DoxX family redox-associated membrane protein [Actinoallomurus rhizosphaericola]MCO5993543.1 hypothetical protein [Actinoallomurus rhizosphaericola]
MAAMLAGVSAGTVALILLAGFAGHLLHPRVLPAALTAHRTVPGLLIWPVAVAVGALEGLFGAVTGYALLAGRPRALTVGATGSALLFAAYALYGLYVLRTRPGIGSVPCGCSADDTPMSGWVAGRAAALALASVTASAGAGSAAASHGVHVAIVALSSVTFAVLLWSLPPAMADPERSVAR